MTRFVMPQFNRARAAKTALAPSLCGCIADGASLDSAMREVFAMLHAVTLFAKGDAVGNIIAQFGIIAKRLDVVGVQQIALVSTFLAGIVVTLINGVTP